MEKKAILRRLSNGGQAEDRRCGGRFLKDFSEERFMRRPGGTPLGRNGGLR